MRVLDDPQSISTELNNSCRMSTLSNQLRQIFGVIMKVVFGVVFAVFGVVFELVYVWSLRSFSRPRFNGSLKMAKR